MNKNIAIFPFRKYEGKKQIGSSSIRCDWLLNYWDEAEEFTYGKIYDTIIYQKVYYPEHARLFKGIKIFDICDPDWLHWGYRVKEMCDEVDAITCATEALANDIKRFTDKPVFCVPDRVDVNLYKMQKKHTGEAKKVVWFGYSHNATILTPALKYLADNKLSLIIISDKNISLPNPYNVKVEWKKYKQENLEELLLEGDFVLNPTANFGKWKYKSNNKTLISWSIGLPVATDPEGIIKFMSAENREEEAILRRKEVEEKYDVRKSIEEYKDIISKIKS